MKKKRTKSKKDWSKLILKVKDRSLSVANGVIGDSLEKSPSLAVPMVLSAGSPNNPLRPEQFGQVTISPDGKVCVLAHGSCGSDSDWNFKSKSPTTYGSLLKKDLGFDPFYLRYNTGLHISTNGKRLSNLLETFVESKNSQIKELILIGHSMGGLVFRSACHYGQLENREWVKLVKKVFYLGSPHLGTHFEKFGKLTTTVLRQVPNLVTNAIASFLDLRSAGIKDMRHGYLTDEDWDHNDAENLMRHHPSKIPLLSHADHYLVCATLAKKIDSRMARIFGDGMVHPASGTGRGLIESSRIPFKEEHTKVFAGVSHLGLLKNRKIYSQIKNWCKTTETHSPERFSFL